MTDTTLGTAIDYDTLQAVMRRVADERGISRESLDELAGCPKGYAGKVLAAAPMKRLGPLTFGPLLQALGLKLLVVDDAEALARYTARAAERDARQVRSSHRLIKNPTWLWSRRKARQMALKQCSALGVDGLRKRARKGWQTRRRRRLAAKAVLPPCQDASTAG